MTDPGEAVLTSAAPRFSDDAIIRIVADSYGVGGRVLRRLNSERDQVVLFGDDDGRQIVVKFSNEAETETNIELEEAAALWAVAADPGLPLSTPLAVVGADTRHLVVSASRRPEPSHFLRAYDRLPGQASLVGADLTPSTVVRLRRGDRAHGAGHARLLPPGGRPPPALARRGAAPHPRSSPSTSTTRRRVRLVEAAFDNFEERVAPTWNALRAQVVHGDITLDNLLIDDGAVTGVLDLGDLTHSTLVFDIAAAFGSLAATLQGVELFRTLRQFLDGYRSVTPLEPAELAALGDTIAIRAAMTLCISHWRAADHPENADVHPRLGRDLAQLAPAVRGPRPRGRHRAARRAQLRRPTPTEPAAPPRRRVRHRAGPADLLRAAAPRARQRRHPDRQRRSDLHRRLQQRPGRRPRAPAGQRRDRRPGPAAQHQPALPAPARHRARRAAASRPCRRASTPSCWSTPAARRPTWRSGSRQPPPAAPARS